MQWRAHGTETVTGQLLVSDTRTPDRPDVNASWTGQSMTSGGGQLQWNHNTTHYDASATYKDFGDGFRADNGFVPQVGYRDVYAQTGWTFRPHGVLASLRPMVFTETQTERTGGALIERSIATAVEMNTRWNGYMQFRYLDDRIRAGDQIFPRRQFVFYANLSPSSLLAQVHVDGYVGTDVDFANARAGRGAEVNLEGVFNPTNHLAIDLLENTQTLRVPDAFGVSQRVFMAHVSRVKGTYTFTARSFVRVIGQYVSTDRDPLLYVQPTTARDGQFAGTALFAYKINWQSVMFVGYGDDRDLTLQNRLVPTGHQVFVKLSYAIQR